MSYVTSFDFTDFAKANVPFNHDANIDFTGNITTVNSIKHKSTSGKPNPGDIVGGTGTGEFTLSLKKNGSAVSLPHTVDTSAPIGTYKLNVTGNYDNTFDKDVIVTRHDETDEIKVYVINGLSTENDGRYPWALLNNVSRLAANPEYSAGAGGPSGTTGIDGYYIKFPQLYFEPIYYYGPSIPDSTNFYGRNNYRIQTNDIERFIDDYQFPGRDDINPIEIVLSGTTEPLPGGLAAVPENESLILYEQDNDGQMAFNNGRKYHTYNIDFDITRSDGTRFESDFNSGTNNYPDGLVNNLNVSTMGFRLSNVSDITAAPWSSIPSSYQKVYSYNLKAGITSFGPQVAIYTSNSGYSNSANTWQTQNSAVVDFTYFVPTGHPAVGQYFHIGAANSADAEDAPNILDYKDFYSPSGVQIVGGQWTTARLYAGSYYGGRDLNGTSRFLTITDEEVFSPTMNRINYTGVANAGDITDATATAQMIFLAGFTISSPDITETEYIRHDVDSDIGEINQTLIKRVTSKKLLPAEQNTSSLTGGVGKLFGSISTADMNTIKSLTEDPFKGFKSYFDTASNINVCTWRAIEPTRGNFDFSGADVVHSFCKQNGIKFLWHTLLWGDQQGYPTWFVGLSHKESREALDSWFEAIANRYGDDIYGLEVLKEITPGHQEVGNEILRSQLTCEGEFGLDWVIYVYKRARHYFPNAVLWSSDYDLLNNKENRDYMINVVNTLKEENSNLIDAFGCQGHYFTINDLSGEDLQIALNEITEKTSLPIHITEWDISGSDRQQLERYHRLFTRIWKHENVERISLWGHYTRENWKFDEGILTGLLPREGVVGVLTAPRPAWTWLVDFIQNGIEDLPSNFWTVVTDFLSYDTQSNPTLTPGLVLHSQSIDPTSVAFNRTEQINTNVNTIVNGQHYDYVGRFIDGSVITDNYFQFYVTYTTEYIASLGRNANAYLHRMTFSGVEVESAAVIRRNVLFGTNPPIAIFTDSVGGFNRADQTLVHSINSYANTPSDGSGGEYLYAITVPEGNTTDLNILIEVATI